MKRRGTFIILGIFLLAGLTPARAAGSPTDWPSLGADAALSNYNPGEHLITAQNALKLRVRWSVPVSSASYPIVSGNQVYVPIQKGDRIHVNAYTASSGKLAVQITKDASGGMVAVNGTIYLAGHVLQAVTAGTNDKVVQINARPHAVTGTFVAPVADDRVVVAGYASTSKNVPSSLYAINPNGNQVTWKSPSVDAASTIGNGKIITATPQGTAFYDELSGKVIMTQKAIRGQWFAGSALMYTVAALGASPMTLYAYAPSGKLSWQRRIGPRMITLGWPHAVTPDALYVANLKGGSSVQALDPGSGQVLWNRPLANVASLAAANNLVFALTYTLGQQARVVVLRADTGKAVGAIVLSTGFSAFNTPNDMMVADGMVFLRVQGPAGSQLLALGL